MSDIWNVCESGVPGPGVHDHVGLRVESKKPKCSHELLWPVKFSGTLSSLGAHGFLSSARQLCHRRPFR